MLNPTWAPSPGNVLRFSRSIHHSACRNESVKQRTARIVKARNIAKQEVKQSHLNTDRPHPVLGLEMGDKGDESWKTTKLYRTIIKKEDLAFKPTSPQNLRKGATKVTNTSLHQPIPKHLHFGLTPDTASQLLNTLPQLTVEQVKLSKSKPSHIGSVVDSASADIAKSGAHRPPAMYDTLISRPQPKYDPYNYTLPPSVSEAAMAAAAAQSSALSRIVDLRNASAGGIAFANRKKCIEAFSNPTDGVERKGPDTGRPEVQAALFTTKIRNLWDHLRANPRDIHNRRSLRGLVHQRAKVLKYLKKLDPERYVSVLPDLGLDPRAVEGEIIIR